MTDPKTPEARLELARDLFELPMAVLSLAMLGLVVLEVALPLSPGAARAVEAAQWVIWGAFTLEYFTFLLLSPDKLAYVRKNWFGLLTVILPFLRVFRAFRAVRAVRALRAVRVANLTRRGAVQFRSLLQWSSFAYFMTVVVLLIFLAPAAMVWLEPAGELGSYGAALWWAVGVVTTIGSSLEPQTLEGRLLAGLLYVLGLAVPAYLGGVIASTLIGQRQQDVGEARPEEGEGVRGLEERLERLEAKLDRLLEGRPGGGA